MATPEPIADLLKAVNEASAKAFALWITFITVGTYLAIAIGTTTDVNMLLNSPVRLPLLGVDLPLFSFYGFAPPLFVVLHFYVLMQLYLLARLLRLFDDELRNAVMIEQDRRKVRGQLDKFVFTQFLVGGEPDRIIRLFLWMVVMSSFVFGPIFLLWGFQIRFSAYHSIPATYLDRVILASDMVLLFLFWRRISEDMRLSNDPGLACFPLFAFSLFFHTIPGEPTDLGLMTSRLIITEERLVEPDEGKLSKLHRTLLLRDRDFHDAHFYGSDLRKVDLEDADLGGAKLDLVILSGANLSHTNLSEANLPGAKLIGANLMGADLSNAHLRGADLTDAKLHGEDEDVRSGYHAAKLHGADLSGANLSGTEVAQYQLDEACGDALTSLPGGRTIKPCPERR